MTGKDLLMLDQTVGETVHSFNIIGRRRRVLLSRSPSVSTATVVLNFEK
jgi:hypothetical protein